MIPEQDLRAILEDAVWAPSGDNVQPWRFTVTNDALYVINDAASDASVYNYGQRASLLSIGTLLENIRISAAALSCAASIDLFPEGERSDRIARVTFSHTTDARVSELYETIRTRCTNRKKYDGHTLRGDERSIFDVADTESGIRLSVVEDERRLPIAKACSVNEKIVLENSSMRDFLFRHVTWTKEEDVAHPGFFVDTLELQGPQRVVFGLYRHRTIANILNAIGFASIVARENAKIYGSSSAMIALCSEKDDAATYVKGGMLMQRLWLTATKLGLAVQPMAGTPLLRRAIGADIPDALSDAHAKLLLKHYEKLRSSFNTEANEQILIVLRVGSADMPSARTGRAKVTYNKE